MLRTTDKRALYRLAAGALLLAQGGPVCGQVMTGRPAKKGEVTWRNTYLGWSPQAWFEGRGPLSAALSELAPAQAQDSLALVMRSDYFRQLPSGTQYIRVHLLNPTAQKVPLARADATVLGFRVAIRLDEQWVLPAFSPQAYCGNSFWDDTLAARSYCAVDFEANSFYSGTIPTEARLIAQVGQKVVKSPVFTVQLTPLQLYYLRHPKVPLPDIN